MISSGAADLVSPEEARQIVLSKYGYVDASRSLVAEAMYPPGALADLPVSVKELALGVGDPMGYAGLNPGEVVLDLGAGGGIDTFLAARAAGPEGRAIGLDITPEMVSKAQEHASLMGSTNVDFRQGSMEKIPLPDSSVDVIISNSVVSMSMRKHMVFWEAWRVLKPGGRMVFGNMALNGQLPVEIRKHSDAISS